MTHTSMDFVERMAVAGYVAPRLRRKALAPRLINVTDKMGTVVRFSTDVEVGQRVLARHDIEFGIQGSTANVVACTRCEKPTQKTKAVPVICPTCKGNVWSTTSITLTSAEVEHVRKLLTTNVPLPDSDWGVILQCLLRAARGKKQIHTWKLGVTIFEPEVPAFERCVAEVCKTSPTLFSTGEVKKAVLLRIALAKASPPST